MNLLIRNLILLIFLFSQIAIQAQEPLSKTHITFIGDTIIIKPIALTDINSKIESANQRTNSISKEMLLNHEMTQADSLITADKPIIIQESRRIEEIKELITIKNIEDLKREWSAYNNEYITWQEKITKRTKWFESELEYLNIEYITWQLTGKALKNEKIPEEILERINSTTNALKKLEKDLKKRQSEIFIIQNDLADLLQEINEIQENLDKTLSDLQSQILVQDSPVLWNAKDSTLQLKILKLRFQKSLNENIRIVSTFLPKNKNRVIIHFIITILIIIFLIILNKRVKQLNLPVDSRKHKNAKYVIYHYVSSTLIVGLMISTWLYPNIPTSVRELIILLLLIPTAFLLPILATGRIKQFLFIILFIFLINEILFFYQSKLFFSRIALLIENSIMIWVVYKIIIPKSNNKSLLLGKWWVWIINVSKLFLLLLIGSILSNVFGFMNLAILLNKTVISALLFAIVLSLFVIVINSAIMILLKSERLQQSKIIFKYNESIEQKTLAIVQILVFFLWLRAILKSIGFLSNVSNWLIEVFINDWEIGPISFSIANIFGFFFILIATYIVSKSIKIILEEEIFSRIKLPRGVPGAVTMLTGYFIVGAGLILALSVAGIDLSKFSLMAGALGVGIGFGLQNVVNNFISGLILAFERPIQIGDTIEVGNLMGNVKQIGIRASTVRTFDGSEVIVPNGNLISKELINWSLSDKRRRREIKVGVEYGTNPQDVLDLLAKVADNDKRVLKVPKPLCLFDSFGESSLDFRLLFWVPLDSGLTIQSDVTMELYKAIDEAGMQIPYPQHDLHIKSFDPSIQKTILPSFNNKNKKED
ncbi:MAG: hypothetical protein DRJ10_03330 [Bacteroidetes bacterium]|nr:MAG: hypothetical protein DRJ10_03330 [Bacteroidota bacterium]